MPTHAQEQEHKTNTDERTKDKKITGYRKQDTTLQGKRQENTGLSGPNTYLKRYDAKRSTGSGAEDEGDKRKDKTIRKGGIRKDRRE